ncbi:MAG: matrixin family metalloprotease [Alphaproteobacteria bacterium]|nr:matrixin family metalloprotease [Alphaproteobacteria bacterium]
MSYAPGNAPFVAYDGTLRIEAATGRLLASGDLYQRAVVFDDEAGTMALAPPPDPAAGIPILPIAGYRYYLRVTAISEAGAGFGLAFEVHRFGTEFVTLLDGTSTNWAREGAFTAQMAPAEPPRAVPGGAGHFVGEVVDEAGTAVGRLSMSRVSAYLRKAIIEIDRVPASELPLDNGAGVAWRTVFDAVGWDVTPVVSDGDVAAPPGDAWNKAEAHAAMLARRDRSDLDAQWRYYVLAVQNIDFPGGERGVMYDDGSGGANRTPREGLMIASHWPIPTEARWGLVQGRRAGATVTYFRTAVHELGHAMGLDHNTADNGFMHPTDGIAARSLQTPGTPFPENILWSYAPEDEQRLRHWPDIVVRPGGSSLSSGARAPVQPFLSDRHRLDVAPVLAAVPLGAPVRIDVSLVNISDRRVAAPTNIGLASGQVRGRVVDPAGTVRGFAPLTIDESTGATQILEPGEHVDGSMTLLRGGEGALFPAPGAYRIVVEAHWSVGGLVFLCVGEASVMVTAAIDPGHAEAALKLLTTPDALLTLAFGGDHLPDGIAAIRAGLDNAVLRPHLAYVEARRLGTRFGGRPPDLEAAAVLIDATTVMSRAEVGKAMAMAAGDPGVGGRAMAKALATRASGGR